MAKQSDTKRQLQDTTNMIREISHIKTGKADHGQQALMTGQQVNTNEGTGNHGDT